MKQKDFDKLISIFNEYSNNFPNNEKYSDQFMFWGAFDDDSDDSNDDESRGSDPLDDD